MSRTTTTTAPELLTPTEAARLSGLGERTIRRMASAGSISAIRVNGRIKIDGVAFAAALEAAWADVEAEDAANEAHARAQQSAHAAYASAQDEFRRLLHAPLPGEKGDPMRLLAYRRRVEAFVADHPDFRGVANQLVLEGSYVFPEANTTERTGVL